MTDRLTEALALVQELSLSLRTTVEVHVWGDDEPDDDGESYAMCDRADAFLAQKDAAPEILAAALEVQEWAARMGGFEAPCWDRLRRATEAAS